MNQELKTCEDNRAVSGQGWKQGWKENKANCYLNKTLKTKQNMKTQERGKFVTATFLRSSLHVALHIYVKQCEKNKVHCWVCRVLKALLYPIPFHLS